MMKVLHEEQMKENEYCSEVRTQTNLHWNSINKMKCGPGVLQLPTGQFFLALGMLFECLLNRKPSKKKLVWLAVYGNDLL